MISLNKGIRYASRALEVACRETSEGTNRVSLCAAAASLSTE